MFLMNTLSFSHFIDFGTLSLNVCINKTLATNILLLCSIYLVQRTEIFFSKQVSFSTNRFIPLAVSCQLLATNPNHKQLSVISNEVRNLFFYFFPNSALCIPTNWSYLNPGAR